MSNLIRPGWDQYFIDMLPLIARRSTCRRRQVAAIITANNRIMATGYNGAPSKVYDCLARGCLRNAQGIASGTRQEICRAVHAEQNAILHLPHGTGRIAFNEAGTFNPLQQHNIVLYTSLHPCSHCVKSLLTVGITRVVYVEDYPDDLAKDMLAERFIKMDRMDYSLEIKQMIDAFRDHPEPWVVLFEATIEDTDDPRLLKVTQNEGNVVTLPVSMILVIDPNTVAVPKWLAIELGLRHDTHNPISKGA